jgi:glycosyltransferase involved in cell wall biosynthesis
LRTVLEGSGVRPWSCGPRSLKSPGVAVAIRRLVRHLRSHRVTIIHSFDFYSNVLGMLAGRLARVPAVIASQRDLGNLRPAMQQRLHRAVLRLAHRVVVNSPAVAERLRHDGTVGPERICLVPNGVDTRRFAPVARSDRPAGVTVTTLANLRPEKGIADFIYAAARVREAYPDTRFEVWGDGPLRPELDALVGRLGAGGSTRLRGRTTAPEAALRAADIFGAPLAQRGVLERAARGDGERATGHRHTCRR